MTDFFSERNPYAVCLYFCVVLLMIMTQPYGAGLLVLFAALSLNRIYLCGMRSYGKSLAGYAVVVCFFMVFNAVFNHMGETPFLYVNDTPLTVESLVYGAYTGCMVCALFLWFLLFQDIFDSRRIAYLMGRRFPVTGLVIGMVFCYYEKFIWKIHKVQEVWNGYGIQESQGKLKYAGTVLSVLLSVMLEDSVDTAKSMKARGYGCGKKRSSYVKYEYHSADAVIVAASLLAGGALYVCPSGRSVWQMLFCMVPLLYNIGRELQWKYYQSKI